MSGDRPRLIAVDLDGTLLDRGGAPHERDVLALRAALAAGVRVSIVTGRLYSGTRAVAERLGLRGAVGCADGSHLVLAGDHSTLLHHGLEGRAAATVNGAFARAALATFVFAEDAIGHDPRGEPFVTYVSTWSPDIRPVRDVFDHELWTCTRGITAAVGLGPPAAVAGCAARLESELPGALFVGTFPVRRGRLGELSAIIVRASAGSKGTAVRWIAEREGVALADTVCVGDWMNDIPMFEVAGRSFAMAQAPAELKAKATDVLSQAVEQGGGIAHAVHEAFGIAAAP